MALTLTIACSQVVFSVAQMLLNNHGNITGLFQE